MITDSDIAVAVKVGALEQRTPKSIRALIFSIVNRALDEYYGDNAAIKCYQSSLATCTLLKKYGIESVVLAGDLCLPERMLPEGPTWGGFWGSDPHAWVQTDFHETVDLTVNRLNRRPIARSNPGPNLPAIWWHAKVWPRSIIYLPSGVASPDFDSPSDYRELEEFLRHCEQIEAEFRSWARLSRLKFGPVVSEIADLQALCESGHPWSLLCKFVNDSMIEIPDNIRERRSQLITEHGV